MSQSLFLPADLIARAQNVRLLLMDCDGVLTDGRLYVTAQGESMKVFHVRDGQGIALWHAAGFRSGIITGRDAREILSLRVAELGMSYLHVNSKDKLEDLTQVARSESLSFDQVAYIGDDVGDLPILENVGFPVVVGDGVAALEDVCLYRTKLPGGYGAVREVVDLLLSLKSQSA